MLIFTGLGPEDRAHCENYIEDYLIITVMIVIWWSATKGEITVESNKDRVI
jgi:hypothetical protein